MRRECSSLLGKTVGTAQDRLRRSCPQAYDDLRLDQPNLRFQPRTTGVYLRRIGFLVDTALPTLLELEVLDHIGDVDLGAVDPSLFQRAIEQTSGRPHERDPLQIFFVAGLLAKKDQSR